MWKYLPSWYINEMNNEEKLVNCSSSLDVRSLKVKPSRTDLISSCLTRSSLYIERVWCLQTNDRKLLLSLSLSFSSTKSLHHHHHHQIELERKRFLTDPNGEDLQRPLSLIVTNKNSTMFYRRFSSDRMEWKREYEGRSFSQKYPLDR